MRMSRVYLVLSIVSMLAAVFVGAAHKHHRKKKREARQYKCTVQHNDSARRPDSIPRFETGAELENLQHEALLKVQSRDYEGMLRHAEQLLKLEPETALNHELRAYALRGKGMHSASALAYETAIQHALADGNEDALVVCDSYIGLAANQAALGNVQKALESINIALELTEKRRRADQSADAYYQLACAYAVRSTLVDKNESAKNRGQAIANLKFAIEGGYDGWDHMRNDLDLKALHGYAAFEKLFPNGPLDD